ncbi:hypothetical protein ACV7K9_002717 [Escherichia coli]
MDVRAFIEWLQTMPQDAVVQVIHHESGTTYYDQGGNIEITSPPDRPALRHSTHRCILST